VSTSVGEFEVELVKSKKLITVAATQSILDALMSHGVEVKSLCKEGWCGTCKVGLVSGEVIHQDSILDDDERTRWLQVCVSRAKPGSRLLLDL
jgi:ferredoxin